MARRMRVFIAAAITLLALLVFGAGAVEAFLYAPASFDDTEMAVPWGAAQSAALGDRPERLAIPKAGVDAAVDPVGIAASGHMAVPRSYSDVGWYRYGPAPGQKGTSVMAGHVDNGAGLKAVFANLKDVAVGDDVYVRTKDGESLHFIVSDIKEYPYESVPSQVVFGQGGAARLNLVTCEGVWVKGDKTYDHRLVVFTTLAPQAS